MQMTKPSCYQCLVLIAEIFQLMSYFAAFAIFFSTYDSFWQNTIILKSQYDISVFPIWLPAASATSAAAFPSTSIDEPTPNGFGGYKYHRDKARRHKSSQTLNN